MLIFEIRKLFGTHDFTIDMSKRCAIIIGENGIGKTTALKMLKCLATGDFVGLTRYPFRSVILRNDDDMVSINYKSLFPEFNKLCQLVDEDIAQSHTLNISLRLSNLEWDHVTYKWPALKRILDEMQETPKKKKDYLRLLASSYWGYSVKTDLEIDDAVRKDIKTLLTKIISGNVFMLSQFASNLRYQGLMKTIHNLLDLHPYDNEDEAVRNQIIGYLAPVLYYSSTDSYTLKNEYKLDYIPVDNYLNQRHQNITNISEPCFTDIEYLSWNDIHLNDISEVFTNTLHLGAIISHRYYPIRVLKSINSIAASYIQEHHNQEILTEDEVVRFFEKNRVDIENYVLPLLLKNSHFNKLIEAILYNNFANYSDLDIPKGCIVAFINFFNDNINSFRNERKKAIDLYEEKLNNFLFNKKITVCPRGLIIKNAKGEDVDITLLSSGEKKIISLMTVTAFFNNSLFLVDEPELSLSIVWQSWLLPSLHQINDTQKFVVATHSPYIAEDESLHEFVQPKYIDLVGDMYEQK